MSCNKRAIIVNKKFKSDQENEMLTNKILTRPSGSSEHVFYVGLFTTTRRRGVGGLCKVYSHKSVKYRVYMLK